MSDREILKLILAVPILLLALTGAWLLSRNEITGGLLAIAAAAFLFRLFARN